ncbi:MAG: MFS transporter [Thermomicrobiales bacterium]
MRQPDRMRYVFFGLAALGVLMGSIDSTIVAVALPQLTTDLHAPLAWVGWTLTAYQLVQVIMLPVAGKLSDSLGRKRVFLVCVAMFTVGSLLCALAPSIGFLIVFRAIQALGGGGLMPSAVGIISDQFKEQRAQAIGLFTSIFPIGGIIGPNLGGYLLTHWGWRSLFTINVPLGIVVLIGVFFLLKDLVNTSRQQVHIDVRGLAIFACAMVSLLYGLTTLGDQPGNWRHPLPWALVAASVVLLCVFLRHIRVTPHAVMDFNLAVRNPFLAANLYNFFFGAASFGFFSFIPYYAVTKFGLSTQESGTVITPRAILMILASTLASIFIIRLGYRVPMLIGMALVMTTLLLLGQGWTSVTVGGVTVQGFWLLAIVVSFSGLGMGIASPASNNAALDLAPKKAAEITGLRGMFRMTGGIVGIAMVVTVLSFFPNQGEGLTKIFLVLAGILLVTVPLTLLIPDTARERYLSQKLAAANAAAGAAPGPPSTAANSTERAAGARATAAIEAHGHDDK